MGKKPEITNFLEMAGTVFKGLVLVIFSMFTFFVNQLNNNIASLTMQLKETELHQVESDKRIAAIEIARDTTMKGYDRLLSDFAEMKIQMTQNTMRLQTVADFVSKHVK